MTGISKLFATVFSSVIALAGIAALSPSVAQPTATATPPMWRVADGDSEIFLIGTFHILPPGVEWKNDAYLEAFEKADNVYLEADTDTPNAQALATHIMMTEGILPNGGTLDAMLTPPQTLKLQKISAELGLPFPGINVMRPWRAALSLSYLLIVNHGYDPEAGIDKAIVADARTAGKELRYFETMEQQLGFFTGLSPETEKKMLVSTIDEWEEQTGLLDDLFEAWSIGDAGFLDEEINQSMNKSDPDAYRIIIVDRNKNWAEALSKELKSSSGVSLVAVGAGHLVGGANSVPGLLAAKGFEVSRYGHTPDAANDNMPETETDAAAAAGE